MSKRDALILVEEYLGHQEPRIRANAITALAAIGTEASIRRLVEIALTESDAKARGRAETELAGLTGDSLDTARELVRQRLRSERGEKLVELWYLLNRLQALGWKAGVLEGGFFRRLRVGFGLRYAPAFRPMRRVGPVTVCGLIGTIAGVIVASLYLGGGDFDVSGAALLVFGLTATAGGLLSSMVTTRLAVPWSTHHARWMSWLSELSSVALLATAVSLLGALALLITGGLGSAHQAESVVMLSLAFGLVATAVRAGTMLAAPAWVPTSVNVVTQLLAGSGAGILTASLLLTLERRMLGFDADGPWSGLAVAAEGAWLIAVPAVVGLSAAFTWIERTNPQRAARPLIHRLLTVVLIAASIVMVARATAGTLFAARGSTIVRAESGQELVRKVGITGFPFVYRFAATFPQQVQASVSGSAGAAPTVRPIGLPRVIGSPLTLNLSGFRPQSTQSDGLPLCTASGRRESITTGVTRTRIDTDLGWGCFEVQVLNESNPAPRGVFASVEDVLTSRAARAAGQDSTNASNYVLDVRLNTGRAVRFTGTTLDPNARARPLVSRDSDFEFEIKEPRTLRVSISGPSQAIVPADRPAASDRAPTASGEARVELRTVDGRGEAKQHESVRPGASIQGLLEPGKYQIHVSVPPSAPALWYAVDFESTPRLIADGSWPVSHMPAVYDFRVTSPSVVAVTPEESVSLSAVTIQTRSGATVVEGDSKGAVAALAPGDYLVRLAGSFGGSVAKGQLGLTFFPGAGPARGDSPVLQAPPGQAVRYRLPVTALPFERRIVVRFAQDVMIWSPRVTGVDLEVTLRDSEKRDVAEADDPEAIRMRLGPGTYTVNLHEYDDSAGASPGIAMEILLNVKSER
jgi:hypothetical protein